MLHFGIPSQARDPVSVSAWVVDPPSVGNPTMPGAAPDGNPSYVTKMRLPAAVEQPIENLAVFRRYTASDYPDKVSATAIRPVTIQGYKSDTGDRFLACVIRLRVLAELGQHHARMSALAIGWASR